MQRAPVPAPARVRQHAPRRGHEVARLARPEGAEPVSDRTAVLLGREPERRVVRREVVQLVLDRDERERINLDAQLDPQAELRLAERPHPLRHSICSTGNPSASIAAQRSVQCSASRVITVSSTSVSATSIAIPSRWCSTDTRFPRSRATSSSSLISSPGRSATLLRTTRYRPDRVSPCRMTEIRSVASMFPPERRQHAAPDPPAFPLSSAATLTAPAPSTTSLARSSRSTIASLVS